MSIFNSVNSTKLPHKSKKIVFLGITAFDTEDFIGVEMLRTSEATFRFPSECSFMEAARHSSSLLLKLAPL